MDSKSNSHKFKSNLILVSHDTTDYVEALKQWIKIDEIELKANETKKQCICNHLIKKVKLIWNKYNSRIIFVGSSCIKKFNLEFEDIKVKRLGNILKKYYKDNLGRNEYISIEDFDQYLSQVKEHILNSLNDDYNRLSDRVKELDIKKNVDIAFKNILDISNLLSFIDDLSIMINEYNMDYLKIFYKCSADLIEKSGKEYCKLKDQKMLIDIEIKKIVNMDLDLYLQNHTEFFSIPCVKEAINSTNNSEINKLYIDELKYTLSSYEVRYNKLKQDHQIRIVNDYINKLVDVDFSLYSNFNDIPLVKEVRNYILSNLNNIHLKRLKDDLKTLELNFRDKELKIKIQNQIDSEIVIKNKYQEKELVDAINQLLIEEKSDKYILDIDKQLNDNRFVRELTNGFKQLKYLSPNNPLLATMKNIYVRKEMEYYQLLKH